MVINQNEPYLMAKRYGSADATYLIKGCNLGCFGLGN